MLSFTSLKFLTFLTITILFKQTSGSVILTIKLMLVVKESIKNIIIIILIIQEL